MSFPTVSLCNWPQECRVDFNTSTVPSAARTREVHTRNANQIPKCLLKEIFIQNLDMIKLMNNFKQLFE